MDDDARPAARLTVLSGPSGVGKDSVIELIRARSPWIKLSVSVTTRKKRDYETDGEHYHFVSRAEFQRLIDGGQLLEWAEFAGNLYGTPRAQVEGWLAQGRPVLLKIDLQGARQVRAAMPEAVLVFIAPPDPAALRQRLEGRGTDDAEAISERLRTAEIELDAQQEFKYVVVNDELERAAAELERIVRSELAGERRDG